MGSYNSLTTDPDHEGVERGREESRRQERGREESRRQERMPVSVEAVIHFGYPPDLVLSTYRHLLSARATDSQHATSLSGSGDAAMTGNLPSPDVSAATLLAAVDDTIRRRQRDPDDSFFGSEWAGSGAAMSPGPSVGASQGLTDEEDMAHTTQVHGDRTTEEVPSTSQPSPAGPEHRQSASRTALDCTSSSTDSRSSTGNSQSSINTQSPINTGTQTSTNNQFSSSDHASTINANGTVSSMGISDTSASSENPAETASSLTSSCAVSRAAESPADSTALISSSSTTHPVTISSHTASVAQSPAAAAATAADQNTAEGSSPSLGSTSASRDRSCDRRDENEAAREEKARERRRQLTRLRALRAENRRLRDRQTCRHCRQKPVALTLLPCGHFCLCQDCGPSFEECPVCKKTILADVRTFVS